jgi:hypothetical protein
VELSTGFFGTATAAGRKTGIMNAGSRDEDDGDESQVDRDYPIKPLEKTPHSDFVAGAPGRLQGCTVCSATALKK